MKIQIIISFLILCFFQNGFGQTEPLLQKYKRFKNDGPETDFWLSTEREFTYDLNNNLTTRILKGYSGPNEMVYWEGGFYKYDDNNLLKRYTSRRYNQDVDLWITNSWIEYEHDPNGCRIEEVTYSNVGGDITRRVTYTRNENCQITSELIEWRPNGVDLIPKEMYTREYYPDGKSYDEKFYRQASSGDTMYLAIETANIIGENENILESHRTIFTTTQDTFFHTKTFYDYDEYDYVTLSSKYYRDQNADSFELNQQRFYYNQYDENGFMISKETEQWHYDDPNAPVENLYFRQKFIFKNSCEGINEEYTVHLGETNKDVRYEFIYQGINECLDVESLDLNISISPNPSDGAIEISSPFFKTGNTDILVFATDGKVMLKKNENSRCESSFIDLTSMKNGIYILQLQNGDHFVNEKIVIVN